MYPGVVTDPRHGIDSLLGIADRFDITLTSELYKIILRAHNHIQAYEGLRKQLQNWIADIKKVDNVRHQMRNDLQKLERKVCTSIATLQDIFTRAQRMQELSVQTISDNVSVLMAFLRRIPARIEIDLLFQGPSQA
ncbi:MAG: hypothetical protein Q9184_002421 [Pyrenodesmia sp. 2 TL-2023]